VSDYGEQRITTLDKRESAETPKQSPSKSTNGLHEQHKNEDEGTQ